MREKNLLTVLLIIFMLAATIGALTANAGQCVVTIPTKEKHLVPSEPSVIELDGLLQFFPIAQVSGIIKDPTSIESMFSSVDTYRFLLFMTVIDVTIKPAFRPTVSITNPQEAYELKLFGNVCTWDVFESNEEDGTYFIEGKVIGLFAYNLSYLP